MEQHNPIEVKDRVEKKITQQPNIPKIRMSSSYVVVRVNNDNDEATREEKFNINEDSDGFIPEDSVSDFQSVPFETDNNSQTIRPAELSSNNIVAIENGKIARDNTRFVDSNYSPEPSYYAPSAGNMLQVGKVSNLTTNQPSILPKDNDTKSDEISSESSSSSDGSDLEPDFDMMFKGKNNPVRVNFRPKGALSPRSYAKFKVG